MMKLKKIKKKTKKFHESTGVHITNSKTCSSL